MAYILSGDIGGTKTLLQLSKTGENKPLLQKSYASAAYDDLADMVAEFLQDVEGNKIAAACFALAGPVKGRLVHLTNLPWLVDGDALATRFGIGHLALINDFAAVGYGISKLQTADLLTLQSGVAEADGVRLVVGAGTGMGVAWLTNNAGKYDVHASEGGHMDFAPVDDMQGLLLKYLQHRYAHVSYERIVSGPGLLAIYDFMRDTAVAVPTPLFLKHMEEGDGAAVIAMNSGRGGEVIAQLTMEMFLSVYGAFVGNMALASLPSGGIYIAGGIAAKNAERFKSGVFMQAFLAKGRFADLLSGLPLNIVLDANVGLIGATAYAQQYTTS
jgi:glucokinase